MVGGLLIFDWRRTPAPAALRVTRQVEARLSLGAANPVVVTVVNRSPFALDVLVRDEPPHELNSAGEMARMPIAPGSAGGTTLHLATAPAGGFYLWPCQRALSQPPGPV